MVRHCQGNCTNAKIVKLHGHPFTNVPWHALMTLILTVIANLAGNLVSF